MSWVSKGNPVLIESILANLRDASGKSHDRLCSFSVRDWRQTESWLDTSGLALYFLDCLRSASLTSAVDPFIVQRLEQKFSNNIARTRAMLEEFVAINRSFQNAGISFANLKGFTLFPSSCPDLSLRLQSDIDILVDPAHLDLSCSLIEARGYVLTASTPRTLEFKRGNARGVSIDAQYKAAAIRSVELHTAIEGLKAPIGIRDERLTRINHREFGVSQFPSLSPADQFIGQALHILGHLRSEHIRPSWLFEFRRHALVLKEDGVVLEQVHALAHDHAEARIALGLSIWLARDIFGAFSSPALYSWTVDALPTDIGLWAEQYGRRAALSGVPGTKLYLLLEDALKSLSTVGYPQENKIRRLVPIRWPARIVCAHVDHDNLWLWIRREAVQLRFILYRLNFHVKQGLVYLRESRRWKKLLRHHHEPLFCCGPLPATRWGDATQDISNPQ